MSTTDLRPATTFRHATLANGLEVVAECTPGAHSTGLAFFVQTGARDESDEVSGVSHFLEHMVFKGTDKRSAADVNRELDEIGSNSNAYTSEEQTVYHATVLPEYQSQVTELLADILRPALRDDDFQTEKKVILEEIAKYDDQPPYGAHDKCMSAHFGSHPLGRSILGTAASVGALTPQQMRAYFDLRYSPSNIVLAAAGRVDFEQLVADAERWCGGWERRAIDRQIERAAPNSSFTLMRKESAKQQYTIEIGNFPSAQDEDRFAARLLANIIGDDLGSRLFWELIDTGRAEYAGLANYEYQGTGIFSAYLCCQPEDARENWETLSEVLAHVQDEGVTADELERAKSKICSHIVLSAERPSNRLFSVGNNWVQRRAYRTVRETVDVYRSVTLEALHRLIAQYPLTQRTTVSIGPLETW
ncbi:MAG: pitrilysin family protein [Pirellulales bacterium]